MNSASTASAAPPDPARAQAAIAKLRHRIAELEVFRPEEIENRNDPIVAKLAKSVDETLLEIFGAESEDYKQYAAAKTIDTAPYMLGGTPIGLVRHGLEQGKAMAIALLQQAAAALQERAGIEAAAPPPRPVAAEPAPAAAAPVVAAVPPAPAAVAKPAPPPVAGTVPALLVAHGAGDAAGEQIARFLAKTELGAVGRFESAGAGPTDIEALERYGAIAFAVVLLPAQEGGVASDIPPSAGRQKALAELFYFIGKLGRRKLCVLMRGEGATPPVAGVLCAPFDPYEGWQKVVLRGLEEAGYRVDWGKALR